MDAGQPDGAFDPVVARNSEVLDIFHRGCAYTVLQTVQTSGVCSVAYGTVHHKEPLKSFDKSIGHSSNF